MPDISSMLELAGNCKIQRMEIKFKGIKNISNDLNIYELLILKCLLAWRKWRWIFHNQRLGLLVQNQPPSCGGGYKWRILFLRIIISQKDLFFLELNYLYRDLLFFSNLGENWYEWQTLFTYFIYSRFALQRYKLLVCIMRQIRLFWIINR